MEVSEEQKKRYLSYVYEEMHRRGLSQDEIPIVIGKTGFMKALNEYPEVQIHYDPADAVDEILVIAVRRACFPPSAEDSRNS